MAPVSKRPARRVGRVEASQHQMSVDRSQESRQPMLTTAPLWSGQESFRDNTRTSSLRTRTLKAVAAEAQRNKSQTRPDDEPVGESPLELGRSRNSPNASSETTLNLEPAEQDALFVLSSMKWMHQAAPQPEKPAETAETAETTVEERPRAEDVDNKNTAADKTASDTTLATDTDTEMGDGLEDNAVVRDEIVVDTSKYFPALPQPETRVVGTTADAAVTTGPSPESSAIHQSLPGSPQDAPTAATSGKAETEPEPEPNGDLLREKAEAAQEDRAVKKVQDDRALAGTAEEKTLAEAKVGSPHPVAEERTVALPGQREENVVLARTEPHVDRHDVPQKPRLEAKFSVDATRGEGKQDYSSKRPYYWVDDAIDYFLAYDDLELSEGTAASSSSIRSTPDTNYSECATQPQGPRKDSQQPATLNSVAAEGSRPAGSEKPAVVGANLVEVAVDKGESRRSHPQGHAGSGNDKMETSDAPQSPRRAASQQAGQTQPSNKVGNVDYFNAILIPSDSESEASDDDASVMDEPVANVSPERSSGEAGKMVVDEPASVSSNPRESTAGCPVTDASTDPMELTTSKDLIAAKDQPSVKPFRATLQHSVPQLDFRPSSDAAGSSEGPTELLKNIPEDQLFPTFKIPRRRRTGPKNLDKPASHPGQHAEPSGKHKLPSQDHVRPSTDVSDQPGLDSSRKKAAASGPPQLEYKFVRTEKGMRPRRLAFRIKGRSQKHAFDEAAWETSIYSQPEARVPADFTPSPLAKTDCPEEKEAPMYIYADPRKQGMHRRSEHWHRVKSAEIASRSGRKAHFGRAKSRMRRLHFQKLQSSSHAGKGRASTGDTDSAVNVDRMDISNVSEEDIRMM